jgi:hypothetical protein
MKVIKINNKIRCELGVCNNLATYALTMSRTGIRSRIYLCEDCLKRIYAEAKAVLSEKTEAEKTPEKAAKSPEKAAKSPVLQSKSTKKPSKGKGGKDERA